MTGKAAALDRVLASASLCRRVGLLIWRSLGVSTCYSTFDGNELPNVARTLGRPPN